MPAITLLTDFGLKDGNVAAMKGVIINIAPESSIIDISHNISPQNIPEAALILARSAPYFPSGAIHTVVVDPGVGTDRRPIGAQLGDQFFIGPDNGVISMLLVQVVASDQNVAFVHLNKPEYWLPEVSNVFHGRDIFAPCAAHLASGVELEELGETTSDIIHLALPEPEQTSYGYYGEVIHLDHFGNISTNIRVEHLRDKKVSMIRLCGAEINGMVRTFGEKSVGELVALFGSTGSLIVSVVNGSAALRLKADFGDKIEVFLEED
jgi:S-adenosylmethionine hydrolase